MYREIKLHLPMVSKYLKEKETLVHQGRDKTFRALLAQALEFETDYTTAEIATLVNQIRKEKNLEEYKTKMETDRNKLALKVQQIQDKVIPQIYKKVQLEEFEDLETIELAGPEILVRVVDQVELYKAALKKKKEDAKKI